MLGRHQCRKAPTPVCKDEQGKHCVVSRSEGGAANSEVEAFTLIELLVVIAIIVILAAMLLPSLSRSKAQAQSIVCENHLHEMALALRMYADDSKAYPYYVGGPPVLHWYDSLQPYYRLKWSNPAFHCPAYAGVVTVTDGNQNEWGSYSYNIQGAADTPATSAIPPSFGVGQWNQSMPPRAENQVVAPSGTFAFMDTAPTISYEGLLADTEVWDPSIYFRMGTGWTGYDFTGCFVAGMYDGNPYVTNGMLQHGKVMNVVSCDAHVDSIRAKDLFNPKISAQNWNYDHQAHEDLWP